MYEATQTDIDSQLVRIPTDALWLDFLSQQADSARQVPGCYRRTAYQTTEGKEIPPWIG